MGKALVIAEKPSVARDIAQALGRFQRHKERAGEYYENDRYIIASSIGHLLELVPPEGFEDPKRKWQLDALPVLPPHFDLKPIEETAGRLQLLKKLVQRPDVDLIINACDAGREGELIFRYLMRYFRCHKPIRRLWLQSMTPEAIRQGFNNLRSDEEMQPLANAAVCRSEADWLVGINGTRAMTAFRSPQNSFQLTTVGRVQTPTLAIVVERERAIRNFVPREYWEIKAVFQTPFGTYEAQLFDEFFSKEGEKAKDPDLQPERIFDRQKAERIAEEVRRYGFGFASDEAKVSLRNPPPLFDLTSLQREANNRFGFSAQQTLSLAQSLYERHKVLTYPRTDSRALPEDYVETCRRVLEKLLQAGIMAGEISRVLEEGWVRPNKRIFNNSKVSDHFAIIPTGVKPTQLTEAERKIYEMVLRRFIAVFYPPAKLLETLRLTRVGPYAFRTHGKVLAEPGWMVVYGRESDSEVGNELVPLGPAPHMVFLTDISLASKTTKPPPRFTEATLLSAMESAGKLVEDEELRAAMADKGLGTPATRAQIIENLIEERYLMREGRELVPTQKAFELLELLQRFQIDDLTRPELTGEWEYKLKQMERRQLQPEQFMEQIRSMVRRIVEQIRHHAQLATPLRASCPACGGACLERIHIVECQNCGWNLRKRYLGRTFSTEELEQLLEQKRVGPLSGFISRKSGKPFSAIVVLDSDNRLQLEFPDQHDAVANADPLQPAVSPVGEAESVGSCPLCGGQVFSLPTHYVCEHALGDEALRSCSFKISKKILQRELTADEVRELLMHGRVGPLRGFVSRRGQPFEAILVLDEQGQLRWEFGQWPERRSTEEVATVSLGQSEVEIDGKFEAVGECPLCGGTVRALPQAYVCEHNNDGDRSCPFYIQRILSKRQLTPDEVRILLRDRKIGPLSGFISKTGRSFEATLTLTDTGRIRYEFRERRSRKGRTSTNGRGGITSKRRRTSS